MSLFNRLLNFIRRPMGFVGKDLQGNYFYEYASTTTDPRRTRRVVKYRGKTDMLEVANRSRELAVQWKAWLTHTRQHPPTLEELRMDVARRERLAHNVSIIEARVQAEREEQLRLTSLQHEQLQATLSAPNLSRSVTTSRSKQLAQSSQMSSEEKDTETPILSHTKTKQEKQYGHDPWVPRPASDEPQAWVPRAASRG